MKPWREVAVPHTDVLKGTFQQAEFAADITAVQTGKAPHVYQDAASFFERTYITEGMRQLLTQVAQRLSGRGGEPVIQLQTAFGGGKTHTLLAVLHLATRQVPLSDLPGIPSLVEKAGLMDVPQARVAVIDGTARAPGQSWKHGRLEVRTLWGELAWQLGRSDGFSLLREADANGTSPGKEVLRDLLAANAPCVILLDELVAYVRQFPEGQALSGGTYDSNLSFVQALTEAVKLVPTAVVLASLPESEIEAGSSRGVAALKALEKTFGRVQALWKPVATEEAFEIVRRRLFEPVRDEKARDTACRAFADAYVNEGAKLPGETQESRYFDRLCRAYPIHPEVFDRFFEDWSTIDGFQRTRGVLNRDVLASAIRNGAASRDFFGTAYGQDGGKYEGFEFGIGSVSVNDTLLLIELGAAKEYAIALQKTTELDTTGAGKAGGRSTETRGGSSESVTEVTNGNKLGKSGGINSTSVKAKSFLGSVDVPSATAKMKLIQIAEEVVSLLSSDPTATVRVMLEISADFPTGASDTIKRAVSENSISLGFKTKEWE